MWYNYLALFIQFLECSHKFQRPRQKIKILSFYGYRMALPLLAAMQHSPYFYWGPKGGSLRWQEKYCDNNVYRYEKQCGLFLVQMINNDTLLKVQQLNTILVSRYFEPSATQEMLDLWRPLLCPFDAAVLQRTLGFLDWFLPTLHLPNEAGLGYELWFNEFMDLWKTCHNSPPWESVSFV